MIEERYRLDRPAVSAEVGVVFEATDLVANRRVTLEAASSLEEPRARLAWSRDAMMAQRLEGEHVLHVLAVGVLPDGVPYAVRELSVSTLAAELQIRGALPAQEAVGWTLEACEAIAEAHAIGMAHGDLRLDNIHLARGAHGMTVKVAWTSAAKAERAAKGDVARDIAALGALLRVLVAGRLNQDEDGAPTLPSDIAHVVARALAEDPDATFPNVAELARALAPYAPPGHGSARTIAFMLSRAGIVSATIPLPPPPERRSLTDEWFGGSSRRSLGPPPAPSSYRGRSFALVSVALVGFVLGASWLLWEKGKLPHWSGAAPPEETGTTQLTSAPVAPAEPTKAEEPASTPVEALPSVPAPTAAPRATAAPATKAPPPEVRAVDPTETAPSVDPTTTPSGAPRAAPATEEDTEPTPAPAPSAPSAASAG